MNKNMQEMVVTSGSDIPLSVSTKYTSVSDAVNVENVDLIASEDEENENDGEPFNKNSDEDNDNKESLGGKKSTGEPFVKDGDEEDAEEWESDEEQDEKKFNDTYKIIESALKATNDIEKDMITILKTLDNNEKIILMMEDQFKVDGDIDKYLTLLNAELDLIPGDVSALSSTRIYLDYICNDCMVGPIIGTMHRIPAVPDSADHENEDPEDICESCYQKRVKAMESKAKSSKSGNKNRQLSITQAKSTDIDLDDIGTYQGETKSGRPHGKGVYKSTKFTYIGSWKNGDRCGKGKTMFTSSGNYIGDYKDGYFHGKGRQCYSDGEIYTGEFQNDKHHGRGYFIQSEGDKYVGSWIKGLRHGIGKRYYSDGIYIGSWIKDQRYGIGFYDFGDNSWYKGEWKDDERNGNGRYNFEDTVIYNGSWLRNDQSGLGTCPLEMELNI
jgi:hypothetical protein